MDRQKVVNTVPVVGQLQGSASSATASDRLAGGNPTPDELGCRSRRLEGKGRQFPRGPPGPDLYVYSPVGSTGSQQSGTCQQIREQLLELSR